MRNRATEDRRKRVSGGRGQNGGREGVGEEGRVEEESGWGESGGGPGQDGGGMNHSSAGSTQSIIRAFHLTAPY